MLELYNSIRKLAKDANVDVDLMDIGCTLTNSMSQEQQDDLASMIKYMSGNDPMEILANVLHDLAGLKAIYLNDPHGDCFVPRSTGFHLRFS